MVVVAAAWGFIFFHLVLATREICAPLSRESTELHAGLGNDRGELVEYAAGVVDVLVVGDVCAAP